MLIMILAFSKINVTYLVALFQIHEIEWVEVASKTSEGQAKPKAFKVPILT